MKIKTVALLLSLWASACAAQDVALSRDEAGRQLASVFASAPITKVTLLEVRGSSPLASKTALPQQEDNRQRYSENLIRTLTGTDGNFNPGSDYFLSKLFLDQNFIGLRRLWLGGLIDHFDVDLDTGNIDITGTVKDLAKDLCVPERAQDTDFLFCKLVLARKSLKAVTGIATAVQEGREIKLVEFTQATEPTPAGQAFGLRPEIQAGRALFLFYDDGWRIVRLLN